VLLDGNVHLHMSACTQALLEHFNWELFDHPPYSLDFTPSDSNLFTYLENWLKSQCFSNYELIEGVKTWQSSQATEFFDTSIQKHILRYDKYLNSGNDIIEKQLKYVLICIFCIYKKLKLLVLLTGHRGLLSK
jgi:hypothetical protein